MKIVLGNASIITVDKDRRLFDDGAVAVQDGMIEAVGTTEEIKRKFSDWEFTDMKRHIIMPGLVNAHVHLTQSLIKGCADDVSLVDFLKNGVWRLMGHYSAEDAGLSAKLCVLEMIKGGTTTFVETLLCHHYGLDGITDTVADSGMRAFLAKSVMDKSTYADRGSIMDPGMVEDGDLCLKQAVEWKEKSEGAGNGRIHIWLGPRPVGSSTKEMLEKVSQTAAEHDMGIAIHFCEVKEDVELMKNKYQSIPGKFMEDAGILTDRTLMAHCVWITREDMKYMKKHGSTVVHCPASNAKLASGIAPVAQMLEEGVNVALGTDAGTCDNAYDMFDAMRLAAILPKAVNLDPLVVPAESVIEMATINGAKAVKMDNEIGSLEAGKKADLITIDCNHPRIVPNINPVSAVVYSAKASDVDNVMIDGKWVVRNRNVLTMAEQDILDEANASIRRVLSQAGVENKSRWQQ